MIFDRFIIGAFLCISLAKGEFTWDDDEEYYTTIVLTPALDKVYAQDDLDAQAVVDGKMSEAAFASIFPYRDKIRRFIIMREIGVKNAGVEYLTDAYIPQDASLGSTPFKDLVFGLAKDENLVLGAYLQIFCDRLDETWIIMAMVFVKDIPQVIATYEKYHAPKKFEDLIKKQRGPFVNMLNVWISQNRAPNEKADLDKNLVTQDANNLKAENDSGGFKETRLQLENVLMKKSIRYALAEIAEFEKLVGKPLEDVIQGNVQSHQLDQHLADAYSAIAKYIKNKHKYIAEIMFTHCDGTDKWTALVMCLAVVFPKEWPVIDGEFQKINKGETLTAFILKKMPDDKVMAEMIAAVIDSNFKPTTFTKVPLKPGAGPESSPAPPAPSTMGSLGPETPSFGTGPPQPVPSVGG